MLLKQYFIAKTVNLSKLKQNAFNNLPDIKSYCEQLAGKVRWWDGDKFVNYPAINRYYLEAKKDK